MKKILSFLLTVVILVSSNILVIADGVDEPMQKSKIKVGTSADFKPFEYYDEKGELTGFDIDLMKYIGEKIGFDIEFVNMSFDKLIPAVISGEVDCAISAITVTEERDSIIDYSRDYLKTYNISFDENEKRSKKYGEQYAIVFREGLSHSPYVDLTEPTEDEILYILIDKALRELSNDRTVVKLIEEYELNKPLDESIVNVEYSAIMGDGDPAAKTYDTEPITSATSVPASQWALADIEKAHALNITNIGGNYNYPGAITREEFCELIYNYVSEFGEPEVDDSHIVFTDTDNIKVSVLNTMGIIKGKSETKFAPNDLLTREEAATILNRLISVVHSDLASTELYFEFADSSKISDWAMGDIQRICNMGIMKGIENNNFAPKDTYTTEQAIVTLVRVYANSGTSKNVIDDTDSPEESAVTDVIDVNDFYIEEAIRLITESGKLASDKDFISLYTTNDEMTSQMLELGAADYSKPSAIYHLSADKEQIMANIKALTGEEIPETELEKLISHKKLSFAVLPNLINASYGSQNLAALTILANNRGYIMPDDFKNDFVLYFEYDEGCSAFVTFSEFGDGVISANMSFVINGDKDNVFRRVYEITEGLGENSIKLAIVK